MFDKRKQEELEGVLSSIKDSLDQEEIPQHLDLSIRQGIERGKRRELCRQMILHRSIWSGVAASLLFISLVVSIIVSPAFAAMVREIPGISAFVDLVQQTTDRGIQLAVENQFIQGIGLADEHDGITLTVDGIIVDDSRMVIFYTVQSEKEQAILELHTPQLLDKEGEALQAMISWDYPGEEQQRNKVETGLQQGTINIQLAQGQSMPEEAIFKTNLVPDHLKGEGDAHSSTYEYQVRIPIDRAMFANMKEEYELNQTLEVAGQKVTFVKAIVHPLQIALQVEYDENNSKQIFDIADLHLVDEEGRVWNAISGSGGADRNKPTYYFESNFFHQPKQLFIEGELFRALDRDKMQIVVDTEQKRLLSAPNKRLKLENVTRSQDYTMLTFSLNGLLEEDKMMYSLLEQEFTDAEGKVYSLGDFRKMMVGWASSTSESKQQESFYYLDNEAYTQPLTFTVYRYPEYVRQAFRLQIK